MPQHPSRVQCTPAFPSILLVALGSGVGWALARAGWPLARFVVADTSMAPALLPGDRLLVLRWGRARDGAVVVTRDPEDRVGYLVKRVEARVLENGGGPATYRLVGDNRVLSRDSRAFGLVPATLIIGTVLWRYLPGNRRGFLRPPNGYDADHTAHRSGH